MRSVAVMLLLVSCTSGGMELDVFEQIEENSDTIAVRTCDCFAVEYASYDECLEGEGIDLYHECTRAVYDRAPSLLEPSLRCFRDVDLDLLDCTRSIACDVDAWAACYERWNDAIAPCLVDDAQAEVDAFFDCFPGDF